MITFVTLFLGLVVGSHPIGVTVAGPVARVEYRLDGEKIGEAASSPWTTNVDFGANPAPHVVTASAFDAKGAVLASTTQWINLPRPQAEAEIALEAGKGGEPAAVLISWQSYDDGAPTSVALTLDGEPLKLEGDRRAPLPKLDLNVSHLLSAELHFGPKIVTTRDVVFGGGYGCEVATELTGIPLRLLAKGEQALTSGELQGRLLQGGEALNVAALEDGPAKVLVVSAQNPVNLRVRYFTDVFVLREDLIFDQGTEIGFVAPGARHAGGTELGVDLFATTPGYDRGEGGLLQLMAVLYPDLWRSKMPLRFCDAVAVAGLKAATENRRRAVVVLLPDGSFKSPTDVSLFTAQQVRKYLAEIGVPLHVWSLTGAKADAAWGETEDISNLLALKQAFLNLRKDLESQRIALVDGRHLLRTIQLKPGVPAVETLGPSR